MREIKFRAWVQKEKDLCLVNEVHFDDFGSVHKIGWFTNKLGRPLFQSVVGHECTYIDLLQYTGLKDKNGVEIYEGDRIVITDEHGNVDSGVVGFRHGSFVIDWGDNRCMSIFQAKPEEIENSGNIYENPELLT